MACGMLCLLPHLSMSLTMMIVGDFPFAFLINVARLMPSLNVLYTRCQLLWR
jgi:hypothetical protein